VHTGLRAARSALVPPAMLERLELVALYFAWRVSRMRSGLGCYLENRDGGSTRANVDQVGWG
jgi:hypothetical protein